MARLNKRDPADRQDVLRCESTRCPVCHHQTWMTHHNARRLILLTGSVHYTIKVRQCQNTACAAYKKPLRPEAEGALALPHSEYGLDVLALIGTLRYEQHRSVPEIHATLLERNVEVSERTVTLLVHRYEELLALRLMDLGCERNSVNGGTCCWPLTVYNRTWDTKCCGCSGTCCPVRFCWHAPCWAAGRINSCRSSRRSYRRWGTTSPSWV